MKRPKPTKILPYLVVLMGIYQIVSGIIIIKYHVFFVSYFLMQNLLVYNTSALLPAVYGFFLIILYRGLKKKTWTSWYMAMFLIVFYYLTIISMISRLFFIDIIGFAINTAALYVLVVYKDEYVFPPLTKVPMDVMISVVAVFMALIYGISGSLFLGSQFKPPITNFYTALYYTVVVLTTLGFGDIVPVTVVSRMFTISLVVFGLASFLGAIVSLVGPMLQKRVEKVVNIMENVELSGLKNHVIFCGYSPLIQGVLSEMKNREIPMLLIVRDHENATFLRNDGYLVFRERADNLDVLLKAGIKRAKEVYIASNDDGYNLLVALTIAKLKKENNLKLKISIIVSSSKNTETIKDFADEVIDVSNILKRHIFKK
ncbi:MAG: NAD-binding protein [Thermoplasmata archaeon]